MDEAASVAAPDLRVREGSVEDAAIIKADGSVSRDGVTPYEYGAKYSAKALNEAEAVIHSHPDHSAKELAGPGDGAIPLKAGKANYVVFKDKLGVTEIEGGQLQFRMVEGKISNGTQRRYIRNALKRQLWEHNKEAK